MKTFNDIRGKILEEEDLHEAGLNGDPPAVLNLRRKYIRVFPNNIKVAVYYSDQLKQFISVPYSENTNIAQTGMTEAAEPQKKKPDTQKPVENNVTILKNIVATNKPDVLVFGDDDELEININDANALLSMYARLDGDNKRKVDGMLQKSSANVKKLLQLAAAY